MKKKQNLISFLVYTCVMFILSTFFASAQNMQVDILHIKPYTWGLGSDILFMDILIFTVDSLALSLNSSSYIWEALHSNKKLSFWMELSLWKNLVVLAKQNNATITTIRLTSHYEPLQLFNTSFLSLYWTCSSMISKLIHPNWYL